MNRMKTLTALALTVAFTAAPLAGFAADKQESKAKPYPLETCVVSGEKLGEMGDPYVFEHEGQEVKLCCKSCVKKFNKTPEEFLKKIKDAEKGKADKK